MSKKIVGDATKKDNTFYHKGCKPTGNFTGIMIDGTVTQTLPDGFGFTGTTFVIDKVVQKFVSGGCLGCGADGLFRYGKPTVKRTKPRGINNKLKKLRTT